MLWWLGIVDASTAAQQCDAADSPLRGPPLIAERMSDALLTCRPDRFALCLSGQ
jgi:hypothetical protein